jgi:hypothetical protein
MSVTLISPAGARGAESARPVEYPHEPTMRSRAMYAPQYHHAQEMLRERLRQAEAQRLRRAAWRARRTLAARLLG